MDDLVRQQVTDQEILDISLKIEREGHDFYQKLADMIPVPEIREFLSVMANEETKHEKQFSKMMVEKSGQAYGWENKPDVRAAIQEIFETDIFPDLNDPNHSIRQFASIDEAIDFAIEAEMISMEFYRLLGEYCENLDAKTVLVMLEKAEIEHLNFMKNLKTKYARKHLPDS